ncbi:MAG: TSUP family transporter [Deltaproteobacteria bacterium]|nr:TSUP family transporter [Deltaproteobacteria bacterium]MBW1995949.1 TSUP family transporter [Deltaproteobacteria bacterium]MBW2150344.1 TSUP family transporter [Deltaproteobacteria bacterium]
MVGIAGGIYGVGGVAVIALFFVTFFGLPVYYSVAGVASWGRLSHRLPGLPSTMLSHRTIPKCRWHLPDWLLGILFALGGTAGICVGARCQKFVPANTIKWMLAGIILFVPAEYVAGFWTIGEPAT